MTKIISSCPHFLVADVASALRYYESALGFSDANPFGDPPGFAMPRRDNHIVMLNLSEGYEIRPNGNHDLWDAYFWCTDVDALFEEFRSNAATIAHEPINRPLYGMREIAVKDLDGYMLVFAQDIDGG